MRTLDRASRADIAMGLTGNRLVRDGENRDEGALDTALADPLARVYLLEDGGWLHRPEPAGAGVDPAFSVAEAALLAGGAPDCVLLGHDPDGGGPRLAARIEAVETLPEGIARAGLRALAMASVLGDDAEGQLGQAEHLLNWHRRSLHCGRCGTKTVADAAGYRRRCPGCGEVHFPRTDPVSIMMIHDGAGRCLLGRSPRFPPGMWSCLAGFIEPGETLEDAVRRETLEEAGITVGRVDYFASQPWPFPGSLMIGCTGLATSSDIRFDAVELEDCRWFGREEIAAMLCETHPEGLTAPKPFAIAHHLVRAFLTRDD